MRDAASAAGSGGAIPGLVVHQDGSSHECVAGAAGVLIVTRASEVVAPAEERQANWCQCSRTPSRAPNRCALAGGAVPAP